MYTRVYIHADSERMISKGSAHVALGAIVFHESKGFAGKQIISKQLIVRPDAAKPKRWYAKVSE